MLKNLHIYEVIPTELFVDMKKFQNFVKVIHGTMLEKFSVSKCLSLNKLKGWKFWLGEI